MPLIAYNISEFDQKESGWGQNDEHCNPHAGTEAWLESETADPWSQVVQEDHGRQE